MSNTHTPARRARAISGGIGDAITRVVVDGLDRCLTLGPLASIRVDTWAVDYGLLDDADRLLFCAVLLP